MQDKQSGHSNPPKKEYKHRTHSYTVWWVEEKLSFVLTVMITTTN